MKKANFLASFMIVLTVLLSVRAQTPEPDAPSRFEVGAHFSSLAPSYRSEQRVIGLFGAGTNEAGFGGRFTVNLTKNIALEAESNYFPREFFIDFVNGGHLLQGQFGVKAGKRFGKFGVFGKARPGFASFSKALTPVGTTTVDFNGQPVTFPVLGQRRRTHFSMDLGGVLEFYPSRRVLTRIDVGDTIIHYGKRPGLPPGFGPSSESRTSHNFQLNAGIGFRLGSLPSDDTDVRTSAAKIQRFEVGAQFSSLSFTQIEQSPGFPPTVPPSAFRDTQTQAGFGGRFTYNINPNLALETQGDFFPRDLTFFNNFRAGGRVLQGQAGVKVGKRFESFGIFAKARPGVVSFGKAISFDGFDNSLGVPFPLFHVKRRTHFSFDLGGVLEFYPSRRLVTRFDAGDTMIRYGRIELPFVFPLSTVVIPSETIHNFQFSAGVGFRF